MTSLFTLYVQEVILWRENGLLNVQPVFALKGSLYTCGYTHSDTEESGSIDFNFHTSRSLGKGNYSHRRHPDLTDVMGNREKQKQDSPR